jgi:selenocysteine lyase/cysteine desulfurase
LSSLLYLDTARLGRMSVSAQRAHRDFARFAGEEGCPLYFEHFLARGAKARSDVFAARYPGMACWPGIKGLKEQIRRLTRTPSDLPVLLANRSAQLMKLAARLLFLSCRNVFVTDLGWPPYRAILDAERQRKSRKVTEIAVRDAVLLDATAEDNVVSLLCSEFRRNQCDGLFLTAVSHDGVRLPIEKIVTELEATAALRFVVVDGAQAFCHTHTDLSHAPFDLYLTGSHKWLGAYHPLGIALYGKRRSRQLIETIRDEMINRADLNDPLLRFTEQLESDGLDGYTETVNVAPLLTCSAAAQDAFASSRCFDTSLDNQLHNCSLASDLADGTQWTPLQPAKPFQSGILLLQSRSNHVRSAPPAAIRDAIQREGLAVTNYPGGLLRLSMPRIPLSKMDLNRIRLALQRVA